MWWAVSVAKQRQVIRDRWCATCSNADLYLISGLWVFPGPYANADGDPAAKGVLIPETVDRCNVACPVVLN